MYVLFSQYFLDGLERIDNKIVIDGFTVDQGELHTSFQVVCHGRIAQVCVEGISGECGRLDFYCGEKIGFTIMGGGNIVMNPERTIFEFDLRLEPKALIESPGSTEDTKFLESIGTDFGNSLYKDIQVSSNSLVWKETLGKYIVDRGIQDNHSYDIELLDTKSGVLEERPIQFKSYQGITIEQGNWEVDVIKKSVVVKHDVYDEISNSSFLVWDSPMIDAKVNLEKTPECIDRIGEYVDPGNVIFGNTDCFQFINYTSSLVGIKITGTEGSKVEVLFNKSSSSGDFTSFSGTIGEDGVVEIRFSDLPYLHLNGIRATGPSRVTKIETIMYLEETVSEYSPNPDKTYVARLNNIDCVIGINGVCDYIEYEKYLGEIKEIGRGTDHIDSIPGIVIKPIENGNLSYTVEELEKQVRVSKNAGLGVSSRYTVFQVSIDNNIEVDRNIITTSPLYADYKIRIEQTGIIWKIINSPDYINVDSVEGEHGIFLLGSTTGSERDIEIMTNDSRASATTLPVITQDPVGQSIFTINVVQYSKRIIDGDWWSVYRVRLRTLSENTGDTWRPKKPDTEDPYLVTFKFQGESVPSISLYLIQLRHIDNPITVWEETIIPGKFTKVDSNVTLLNTITKNFIVVKNGGDEETALNWYYYDLLGTNQFYITDQSFNVTNIGPEYLVASGTTLLDLGTGEERSIFGRVININRSDLVGSLGTLVITESPVYPGTWRNLIDNNTTNVEVDRVLDNIYIQVGEGNDLKDEDYVKDISSISTFWINIVSNFKYVIQTYGYLKIYPENSFDHMSGYDLPSRREVFSGYNNTTSFTFALIELDGDKEMEESYIEVRSGSLLRKITLNVVGPEKVHDYLLEYPGGSAVEKPNLIRVFENGTIADSNKNFLYTSTTTPKIEVSGINRYTGETNPIFYSSYYGYHVSQVPISVPNSKTLSYSKYPMKSFGYIRELSQDYSDSETTLSGGTSYVEYLLYMKGKEHFLWCTDNLNGFSSLTDPTVTEGVAESRFDMVLDADGEAGKTIYIVSRYSINNRTFITEYPEETEFKIKRDELEANIKISSQQSIGIDERSQIEYAIPVQVSCNVKNNRGNIFLGSLDYKAITEITDDSLSDVIEVDNNIVDAEGIDGNYIQRYITSNKKQYLSVMIFQLGTDRDVFDIYSGISDLGIEATTNYIIPEIGSDYTITNLRVTNEPRHGMGEDVVTVTSEFDPKYFLIRVDSLERVRKTDSGYLHWYPVDNIFPMWLIQNVYYELGIQVDYIKEDGQSGTMPFYFNYTKYGCNYGFYVEGKNSAGEAIEKKIGFGNITEEDYLSNTTDVASIEIPPEGGSITIHAGIFYADNGIESAEALTVPFEYKFIGENQPLKFSWVDGNLDDGGNLQIVLPPRTRNDYAQKSYVLQVTQPHEYYPLNLYVRFYQRSLTEVTEKDSYKIMFLDDEIDIWSNGVVVGTDSNEYEVKFVHNLSRDLFENKVYFTYSDPDIPNGYVDGAEDFVYLDDLSLEEVERSFDESYVKFRFKPNGSRHFIDEDAYIRAWLSMPGQPIKLGEVKIKQGYYCVCAKYNQPSTSDVEGVVKVENYLSRKSPKGIRLYKIGTPPRGYYNMVSNLPCKSNDDNSHASLSFCQGRGVLSFSAYRREYNEDSETEYGGYNSNLDRSFNDVFRGIELLNISPDTIFESYGVTFMPNSSTDDLDAKVDPRLCDGKYYITEENFDLYTPYVEVNYTLKDEYIREYVTFSVTCKVSIIELDTGNLQDYYFSITNKSNESDEPQDVNLLEFSDYSLKYDYRGKTKQVSYDPASFRSMMELSLVGEPTWITADLLPNANYITFEAEENKSKEGKPAFYRTAQAKIDVKDPRDNYVLKTFYIDIEQEPDIQRVSSDTEIGIVITLNLTNERSSDVSINGFINLYIDDGNEGTITVTSNLSDAVEEENNFTIEAGGTVSYEVVCTAEEGVDLSEYFENEIVGCDVFAYNSGSSMSDSSISMPYSITGDNIFEDGGTYTITFSTSS